MRAFHTTYACMKCLRTGRKINFANSSTVWVKISWFPGWFNPVVDGISLQQHVLLVKSWCLRRFYYSWYVFWHFTFTSLFKNAKLIRRKNPKILSQSEKGKEILLLLLLLLFFVLFQCFLDITCILNKDWINKQSYHINAEIWLNDT